MSDKNNTLQDKSKSVRFGETREFPALIWRINGEYKTCTLDGYQLLGRPSKSSQPDIPVPDKTVSRRQCEFYTALGRCRLRDLGSLNGTWLNGVRLEPGEVYWLTDGDILRFCEPDDLNGESDVAARFVAANASDLISGHDREPVRAEGKPVEAVKEQVQRPEKAVEAEALRQPERKQSTLPAKERADFLKKRLVIDIEERSVFEHFRKKTLLKDIYLEIEQGSMVLILGGSGAGKTTFMNAVMGYEKADGRILYHDMDVYQDYDRMKYEIGYVPQQDLMRMNDSVYHTIMKAAGMRLPKNTSPEQMERNVVDAMEMLGLSREKDTLAGKLSGGQRKRLSIAMEYVGNPSLFFLDEPDSGLDGTMAKALMHNLREIADAGKIVMVISHSPDRAFELFDQVIVLAKDSRDNCGHLVFTGPPKEALRFFGVATLEDIVKKINRPDEGGEGLAEYFINKFQE